MLKKFKSEKASITIEATISLTAFAFLIITLLSVVNICIAQAKIGMAINSAAKEISHYSYLYALTGLAESHANIASSAAETEADINEVLGDVNTVFTEMQNLGSDVKSNPSDISGILEDAKGLSSSSSNLKTSVENLAKDPKGVMFGLAQILANDGWNLAMSRLVAAPLSKVLVQKNLATTTDGDANAYLKFLGVVPDGKGSYIDGLDFSKSHLFVDGSNEIKINVSYDIKIIALLPIDFKFHFNQTAVTHGWLCGDATYRSTKELLASTDNNTIWTRGTITERSELIRRQGIDEYLKDGYVQTSNLTDVPLYSPTENQFVSIFSMNPMYSPEGEDTVTLNDLSQTAMANQITEWCGAINSSTSGKETVTTQQFVDGKKQKVEENCKDATKKIVLVIPEDPGLKEKVEAAIKEANTNGVTIEVVPSYGNGARTSTTQANNTTE